MRRIIAFAIVLVTMIWFARIALGGWTLGTEITNPLVWVGPTPTPTATGATPTPTPAPTVTRIIAATTAYTDSLSNVWGANVGDTDGVPYTTANTITTTGTDTPSDSGLYSGGWTNNAQPGYLTSQPMQWVFDVDTVGTYLVRLKFAEKFFSSCGQRTENIVINGTTQATNYDILCSAGAKNVANDQTYTISVGSAKQIIIQLVKSTDYPDISA